MLGEKLDHPVDPAKYVRLGDNCLLQLLVMGVLNVL